jgi:hypothetical protein
VTSRFEESPCPAPLDHVLTLTSGTKRYSGATGTIFVDGVWDCTQTLPFMAPDPYDGTITACDRVRRSDRDRRPDAALRTREGYLRARTQQAG